MCNFKANTSLALVLFWHSIWQSFKSLLYPLVAPRHQKKRPTSVGIKVCVCECVFYLQHSAFCSLRIFMAVRYAENLTLFKSATGRDWDREMKSRWTKGKQRQKIRKTKWSRNLTIGQQKQDLCLQWKLNVGYCQWRWLRGGWTNVDCVIRLLSSVSVEAGAICWAAGLQQKHSQSFTAYYLSSCWLKNSHTGHPLGTDTCIWILAGSRREGKDQGVNVKTKLTRQVTNRSARFIWSCTRNLPLEDEGLFYMQAAICNIRLFPLM